MKYLGSKTDPKDLVSLEKLLSYGTTLGAASNALTLKNSAGTVLSTLTAANLVTVLGNTAVAVASKVGTATVGGSYKPVYIYGGTPTAVSGVAMEIVEWTKSNHSTLHALENLYYSSGVNIFAYINPTYVLGEYTRDGGTTWEEMDISDADKIGIFTTSSTAFRVGGRTPSSSNPKTHNDGVRITLSRGCGLYCHCTQLMMNAYLAGGCSIAIEYSTMASPETFVQHTIIDGCGGNPDKVILPFDKYLFGNNGVEKLRIVVMYTGSSYPTLNNYISSIKGYSNNIYTAPSELANTGHIYTFDTSKNATFPAGVNVKGALALQGTAKRIYFGTDYIELVTINGVKCLHSNVGFYSDSFVSAGGIGSGGGGGSSVNVKSLSEVLAYSGSEVMTDVPTAYAVHSMYNTFNTAIANVVKTQSNTFPPGSIALWTGSGKNLMTCTSVGNASKPIYLEDGIPKVCTHTIGADVPSGAVFTDTKNTAGSSNKNGTKMFLVAATSQAANPQTYSNAGCYIGTDNCLYSGGEKVATVGDTPSSNQKQPWKVVVKRACPVFALRQGYLYYTASYAQAEHNGDDTVGISIVVRPGHCGKKVLVPEGLAEYLEDRLRHCNDGFAEIIYEAMSYEPSEYEGMVWLRLGDIDEIQFGPAGVIVIYNILPCACFGFRGTEWVCRDYEYMPRSFSTASPFLNVEHGIVTTTKTVPVTIINGLRNAVISNMLRNSKDRGRKKHGVMVTRNVSWKGNFIRPGGRIAARKGFRYVRNGDSSKWKMYCGPVRFYAVHRGVKSPIFSEVTRTMHRR